jgi:hypothetical protein
VRQSFANNPSTLNHPIGLRPSSSGRTPQVPVMSQLPLVPTTAVMVTPQTAISPRVSSHSDTRLVLPPPPSTTLPHAGTSKTPLSESVASTSPSTLAAALSQIPAVTVSTTVSSQVHPPPASSTPGPAATAPVNHLSTTALPPPDDPTGLASSSAPPDGSIGDSGRPWKPSKSSKTGRYVVLYIFWTN